MTPAQAERAELCDLFVTVGPDAPTLCDGWTAHDLAAHLWIRETDPVGATGIVAKPLAGLLERRMGEVKQRWAYPDLVDRIRSGPGRFSVFAIPGIDEGANTTEFFVHHEDVRRAQPGAPGPRDLGGDLEDWMWRRLKLLARAWFRRAEVGVVLERLDVVRENTTNGTSPKRDHGDEAEPETVRAAAGSPIVTVVGLPSELTLFAHGRGAVAQVTLIGEADAVAALRATDLHL